MPYKYWKLTAAILCFLPLAAMAGIGAWILAPKAWHIWMQAVRDRDFQVLVGCVALAVLIVTLCRMGMKLIEGFKFDNEMDEILKKNLKPDTYKAYYRYSGLTSKIRRWWHGDDKKKVL